jgi:hypothetical protein
MGMELTCTDAAQDSCPRHASISRGSVQRPLLAADRNPTQLSLNQAAGGRTSYGVDACSRTAGTPEARPVRTFETPLMSARSLVLNGRQLQLTSP